MARKRGKNYVSNDEITEELKRCYEDNTITSQMAKYIYKIVDNISRTPNFINYTYIEEMKGDAVFRICKLIMDKTIKIIPKDKIGNIKRDKSGNIQYMKNKVGEYITDADGNKVAKRVSNNVFNYFSMTAWRAFQNRIKIEKAYHEGLGNYQEKVISDFEQDHSIKIINNVDGDFHQEESTFEFYEE